MTNWPRTDPPQVAITGTLPAYVVPSGALTDRSGTIAAGGTSQVAAALNASRKYLFIENPDTAEDLWFNFGTAAVVGQPSLKLLPGGSWESPASYIPTGSLNVIAATIAHQFVVKEA